jgi:hypothetical protein
MPTLLKNNLSAWSDPEIYIFFLSILNNFAYILSSKIGAQRSLFILTFTGRGHIRKMASFIQQR